MSKLRNDPDNERICSVLGGIILLVLFLSFSALAGWKTVTCLLSGHILYGFICFALTIICILWAISAIEALYFFISTRKYGICDDDTIQKYVNCLELERELKRLK